MTDWTKPIYTIQEILHRIERGDVQSGFPPLSVGKFTLTSSHNDVLLTFDPPEDTYIDDQLVCTVVGVKVVRKNGSEPTNPEDGVLLADIKIKDVLGKKVAIKDVGVPYYERFYYKVFPYSDHHVYNLSTKYNLQSVTLNDESFSYGLYGFHQDFTDLNPNTCIQYLSQVENTFYEPMMTNSYNGDVIEGGWGPFLTNILRNKPAVIDCGTGKLQYWLKSDNYKERETPLLGVITEAQAIINPNKNLYHPSFEESPFSWLNKIYMKETYDEDGNGRTVIFSERKREGFDPIGFVDFNGEELEGLWIPMAYVYLPTPDVDTSQGDTSVYKFKPTMVLNSVDNLYYETSEGREIVYSFNVPDVFNKGLCRDETYAGHSRYYTGRKWVSGSDSQVDGNGYEYVTNPLDYFKTISPRMVYLGGPIMNVLRDLQYMMYKTTNIRQSGGYGAVLRDINIAGNEVSSWEVYVLKESTKGSFGFYGGMNEKTTKFHSYVLGSTPNNNSAIWDPYYLLRTTGENQYGDQAEKTYKSFMNSKYQIGKADEVREAWYTFDGITDTSDKETFNGYSTLVNPEKIFQFTPDQNLNASINNYEEHIMYPSHLMDGYRVGEDLHAEYGSSTELKSDASSNTGLCSCQQTNLQKVSDTKQIPEMISVGRLRNIAAVKYCPGDPDNCTFEESRNPDHHWLLSSASLVPLILPPVGYKPT